jgi:hypothetical protein
MSDAALLSKQEGRNSSNTDIFNVMPFRVAQMRKY